MIQCILSITELDSFLRQSICGTNCKGNNELYQRSCTYHFKRAQYLHFKVKMLLVADSKEESTIIPHSTVLGKELIFCKALQIIQNNY